MKKQHYRNNFNIDTVKADSLWELSGKYMVLLDHKERLKVYYKSHEDWFHEIETPVDKLMN